MARIFHARGPLSLVLTLALGAVLSCQPNATRNAANPAAASEASQQSSRLMTGPARDLSEDEREGGHVLRKHVGLTEVELRERLERETSITGASTYTDRRTAEHVLGAAIAKSQDQIESWLSRPGSHPNLVLNYDGDEAIGRTMNRGAYQSRPCTHALIVLRYLGPNRYYVLTSYPECR
jgi:hypothetical protein